MKLEKWEEVNRCESLDELAKVILSLSDENGLIQGRTEKFSAQKMSDRCLQFRNFPSNALTIEYGIRQQALYIINKLGG